MSWTLNVLEISHPICCLHEINKKDFSKSLKLSKNVLENINFLENLKI